MRIILVVLTVLRCLSSAVSAAPTSEAELYSADEFNARSITDSLPDDVRSELPGGDLFSTDGAIDGFTAGYFLELLGSALLSALSPMLKMFSLLMGVLLIGSATVRLKQMFPAGAAGAVFDILGGMCTVLAVGDYVWGIAETVREYLARLAVLVSAGVPVAAAVSLAGGGVNEAAVSANGMMLGLSIVEIMASEVLFPVIKLCFGLCIASGIGGSLKFGGISKTLRSTVLFVFALIGSVVSAVMTFQTSIASRADSLSMRAVRFAASHSIPVVGSLAGDAAGLLAESLSLVRTTVGWVGVALIIVITVPVTVKTLLMRLGLVAAEQVADIMGLEREKGIIAEMSGLLGFMAAVCVIASIMFIYAMALFAKGAASLG